MKKSSISIGILLLNCAVALYLFATGIMGLAEKSLKTLINGGEIRAAVTALFGRGDFTDALVVILALLAIAAGVLVLLKLFRIDISIMELLLTILAIFWIVFIVLFDIIYPIKEDVNFIDWMRGFGSHLMVLSGLILSTKRFGS